MKSLLTRITIKKEWFLGPFLWAVLLSIASWVVFYSYGLTMSYNDAMAHVNISRLVFDNQEPGFAQIGSVWLPLNHILPLLFVWNDWAWRSGFAGSIFSMAAYIVSVLAVYNTVMLLTKKKIAAVAGALAFALNLNMLYLQSTPLTEPLYIAFFVLSVWIFTLWLTKKNNMQYLLALGMLGFLQVLTRYDGWFVTVALGMLIVYHEVFINKKRMHEITGKLFLFGLPIVFGITLWLLWNALIFGDPLFFAFGPYSAHQQQAVIEQTSGLITEGNIFVSILAYGYTVLHNVGAFVLVVALAGVAVYLTQLKKTFETKKVLLFVLFLLSPVIFNILALVLGFSIVNVPELNWNPTNDPRGQWFNVRYGIFALPFAAIFLGVFASWRRLAAIIALEVILLQSFFMYHNGVVTITDGTLGASAYKNMALADELGSVIQPNEEVIMYLYFFKPVAFKSGIQLRQIIHEGVSKKWDDALKNPHEYAEWIVMSNTDNGDVVYGELVIKQKSNFLSKYTKVYSDNEGSIYRLNKELVGRIQK